MAEKRLRCAEALALRREAELVRILELALADGAESLATAVAIEDWQDAPPRNPKLPTMRPSPRPKQAPLQCLEYPAVHKQPL